MTKSMIIVVPPARPAAVPVIEIVAGHGAHEGQLHVRVRIDAARHHELAAGVDDFAACAGASSFVADGDDLAVRAQHVGAEGLIGRDDRAALDEYRHCELPQLLRLLPRLIK